MVVQLGVVVYQLVNPGRHVFVLNLFEHFLEYFDGFFELAVLGHVEGHRVFEDADVFEQRVQVGDHAGLVVVDVPVGLECLLVDTLVAHGVGHDAALVGELSLVHVELLEGVGVHLRDEQHVVLHLAFLLHHATLDAVLARVFLASQQTPLLVVYELAVAVIPLGADVALDRTVILVVFAQLATLLALLPLVALAEAQPARAEALLPDR